jgi:hypothetical protein
MTEPWGSPRFPAAFRMLLLSHITSSSSILRANFANNRSCLTVSK